MRVQRLGTQATKTWTDEQRACAAVLLHAAMIDEDAQRLAERLAGNEAALEAVRLARLEAQAGARAAREQRALEALACISDARARLLHGATRGLGMDSGNAARLTSQLMNNVRHARHREADAQVPALWARMRAEGRSKNWAAKAIALQLHLAESTVRAKLKGL